MLNFSATPSCPETMAKILTLILLILCTTAFAQQKGTFTDPRDKKTYKTAKIGEQVWMAENLNYAAESSKCYNDSTAYCEKYGRLYNWNTAMKSCPSGWHLPSKDEWQTLVNFAGGIRVAGKKLKAAEGWKYSDEINKNKYSGYGTDDYGFSALPGGYGSFDGSFGGGDDLILWTSSTAEDSNGAYLSGTLHDRDGIGGGDYDKNFLHSVRCLKDSQEKTK